MGNATVIIILVSTKHAIPGLEFFVLSEVGDMALFSSPLPLFVCFERLLVQHLAFIENHQIEYWSVGDVT